MRRRYFIALGLGFALGGLIVALLPKEKPAPDLKLSAGYTLTYFHGVERCGPCLRFEKLSRQAQAGMPHWQWREVRLYKQPGFALQHGITTQTGILLEFRSPAGKEFYTNLEGLWMLNDDEKAMGESLRQAMIHWTNHLELREP